MIDYVEAPTSRAGSMTMKRALQIIITMSTFGLLFSGVLTYRELFGVTAQTCPAPGAPGTVVGYPACVYGFFMYFAITAVAIGGLTSTRGTAEVGSEELPFTNAHTP